MSCTESFAKVDKEIEIINQKLRSGYSKTTLRRIQGSLYLQATYPPKPGETKPKQRNLALGLKATTLSIKIALEKSIAISADLALGKFNWAEFLPTSIELAAKTSQPVIIAEWVAVQKAEYFNQREENPDTLYNWMADYGYPYRKLPQDAVLSIELLKKYILDTAPNTKARTRAVMAYGKLAKLAEVDNKKLLALKSTYKGITLLQRDLPSLATIIEWYHKMPLDVQFEYAIRAAFGLRPGEGGRFCDFTHLKAEREISVYSTKTRTSRIVYPYPNSLFDVFELGDREPIIYQSNAQSVKTETSSFRTRLVRLGLPFTLYDLRHLYAWHTIVAGLDVRLAAKFMGHSVEVHSSTYNRFLTKEHFRRLRKDQDEEK